MSAGRLRKLSLAFVVGVIAAAYVEPPFFVMVGVLLLAAVAAIILPRRARASALLVIALAGGGLRWGSELDQWQVMTQRINQMTTKHEAVQLVIDEPVDQRNFVVGTITAPLALAGEHLRVRFKANEPAYPGTTIEVVCRDIFLAKSTIALARHDLGVCAPATLTVLPAVSHWRQARLVTQRSVAQIFDQLFTQPTNGFFRALLLGDTSKLAPNINEAFRATGTSHIIAISGLHFSILAGVLNILLAAIFLGPRGRFVALVILFAGYVWLVGLEASVVRGAVFAGAMLAAYVLGRSWLAWHALSLTAAVFLWIDPFAAYSISFLLSFSATTGMILITPAIDTYLARWPALPDTVRITLAGAIGPVLATGPVLLLFTNVPVVSPLANIMVVPLGTILMLLGIVAAVFSVLWLPGAIILGHLLERLFTGIVLLLEWLALFIPQNISSPTGYLVRGVWLAGVVWLFWQGSRALVPKPLLVYTLSHGGIPTHPAD